MIIYGIKNCDTVKKARKWLETNQIEHEFHDFRVDGLTKAKLESWLEKAEWKKVLNTRSTSWRKLDDDQKQNICSNSALELMLDNPTLIKRPVLEHTDGLLIGFKEEQYQQLV